MGIRGLSTFFNNNPDLSKPHKLYNTPVIIDGNNLIYLLYFRNKLDCIYGGDYNKYAAAVKRYFSSFLECKIQPIVIFDGGYDKSNRKYRTLLQRSKQRLTLAQHIEKYGECAGNILPINAIEVFRSVLIEMHIPFAQCDFEADDQITALANYYDCPVLSEDSDFYIFDIHQGFIKLASIETSIVETVIADVHCKYLKCYIYHIDKFLSYFPGIDKNVLPLFGSLVGNDFVTTKDLAGFFSNVQLPKLKRKNLRLNPRQKIIMGLLAWLQDFSLNDGIHQVLCHIKKEKRDHVKSVIEQSVASYTTPKCNLTFIIDEKLEDLKEILKFDNKLITPCGQALPTSFVVSFLQGNFPSFFLNVINLHRVFLSSQVENVSLESSYDCSCYIRQVIYGLLLQHPTSDENIHSKVCLHFVDELDRRNGTIQRKQVMPVFSLKNGSALPHLDSIYSVEKKYLQNLISIVLGTEISYISVLPSNLQLIFAGMNFWLKNCSAKPREEFIYSLIINLIYLNFVKKNLPPKENDNTDYLLSNDAGILTTSSLNNTLKDTDIELAAEKIKKYTQRPVINSANPLKLDIIHNYSELQTCILYSIYLNILLNCPFEHPKLNKCFTGTLLYNMTKEIMSRPVPDLFVAELLGRRSVLFTFFTVLKTHLLKNISVDCFVKIDRSQFPRKKKKKKAKCLPKETQDEEDLAILNKFQCLDSLGVDSCLNVITDEFEDIFI